MSGVKHDEEKLRMDLIPPEAVVGLAEVLTFGSKKYGDRNWEKGISNGRLFAATMRHLWAHWAGEDNDEESGISHLKHAMCNLAFMITFRARQ